MGGASEDDSSSLSRPGRRRTAWPFPRFYPNSARDEWRLDLADELLDCDRLCEPTADPRVKRLLLRGLVAADDDDGDLRCAIVRELVEHLAPVHERHDPVEEDDVGTLARDSVDRFRAVGRQLHLEPALIESDRVE